jgi:hypothetical protein
MILLRRQFFQENNGLRPTFSLENVSDYIRLSNGRTGITKYEDDESARFVNSAANLSTASLHETRERDLSVPLLYTK